MPIKKTAAPDPERQLMIKTKTCQRIYKEWQYYQQEVLDNKATLQQMKDQVNPLADPYDIKQFEKVVDESCMMVPDSHQRYQAAILDLQQFIHQQQHEHDTATNNSSSSSSSVDVLRSSEWYPIAMEILNQQQEKTTSTSKEDDNDDVVPTTETNVNDLADDEVF